MLPYSDEQIFAKVRDCFCEALGLDEEEVELDSTVIDDLGAESLDMLDIVFRLERSFSVKIPRGDVERQASDSLDGQPYEVEGVLTESALAKLKEAMPEVDADKFKPGLMTKDIPRLFTVRTFQNIVVRLLEERAQAAA
jgi:acyl carrier protein